MKVWRTRHAVAVLGFAGLSGISAQAALIPLVGDLPALLGIGPDDASWAITVTLIVAAVGTPTCGRLADLLGRKRVLLWCLVATTVGSLLCAMATAYAELLVGRALQGLSTAVIPLGISILGELVGEADFRRGSALISATMGVGTAAGVAGAASVAYLADWHAVFWTTGAACLVATLAVWRIIPRPLGRRSRAPFDWWGFVALSSGLTCVLLAVTHGSGWGWTSPTTAGVGSAGVLLLGAWSAYELRIAHPLVDLRLSGTSVLGRLNIASALTGVAMFTHVLALPLYLQQPTAARFGAGASVLVAGLSLVPAGLAMMAFAPLGAWLTGRRGHRGTLLAGLVVVTVGYAASSTVLANPAAVVFCSVLIGAGVGVVFATLPVVIQATCPPADVGAANGVNTLMRSIGSSAGSAVAGAVLAATTTAGVSTGYPWLYLLGAAAAAIAVLVTWAFPRELPALAVA
jgi:MFS family permease